MKRFRNRTARALTRCRRSALLILGPLLLLPGAAAAVPAPAVPPPDSASIDGVVVDAATKEPLPGTQVRVVGVARQDVTHEGGEFHLENLPVGRHQILFERLGYRRVVREVVLNARQTVRLSVEMEASAIQLTGIMVTGTARESLGGRAIRPANVVSGQDLARKMNATLAGTLQNEPGLAVTSVGPATARPVIRGLGGDRVLILEDGARVGDLSSSSSDHALSVDPLNAQRIEVVRGPNALLYGSNAIGGVINLIRQEVPATLPERATGLVSLQGQTVNRGAAGGASSQFAVGTFALRGEGSFRTAGDLNTPTGMLENTELRTYSLSAGASHILPWGHYGVAYRYYDNAYGIPGGFVGSHPEGVDIEMRRHSVHAEGTAQKRVGPFRSFDADAKYTNYYHRELEAADIVGTEYGLLTGAGELKARHETWGPFSTGAVGTRVSWQDYAAGGSTDTPPSQELTAALYVLEELDIGPVRVQGGGRYDWHRIEPKDTTTQLDIGDVRARTFGSISASLGLLYAISEDIGAGASVARAYRTPATGELFSQGPHLAAYSFEVGNPDLDAEVGVGVDVFVRIERARLSGEIAAFRNELNNYIYYRDTGTYSRSGLPIYQATGADALLEGFEVSGSIEALRHFIMSGMLSYVRGTLESTDRPLPMMPPLRGHLTARYERPAYFVGVTWRAVAKQERVARQEQEPATQGSDIVDVDAGIRWVGFDRVHSVTVRLDNVTDEVAYDHLSRIRDRDTEERVPGPGFGASVIYRVAF